jgi:hypothetical protein
MFVGESGGLARSGRIWPEVPQVRISRAVDPCRAGPHLELETLQTISSRLRQAEARALRFEGLTMEAIGAMFGVTRQRVSALLKQAD